MHGCYGVGWHGVDGASRYLLDVPDGSPSLTVVRQGTGYADRPEEVLEPGYARLHLSDGTGLAEVDLGAGTVTFSVRHDYDDEAVLHPLLAGPAAAVNHWLGRDSFHAGAVVIGGRAWIVTGDKGDGKSTTLGYLAARGLPVLADDLIIEDRGVALGGPGFVDLRPDAAAALGVGRDIGWLGARMRARMDVPARPERAPIAGWIFLAWADTLALRPVPLADRLPRLYDQRTVQEDPPDPATYLRHAARPCFELRRPKDWDRLPAVYDLLVGELA